MYLLRLKYFQSGLAYALEISAFYTIRFMLVFIMLNQFKGDDELAYAVFGIFGALAECSTLLGSLIANYLLSNILTWYLGFACFLLGVGVAFYALVFQSIEFFYASLALITTSHGFMVCNGMVATNNFITLEIKVEERNKHNGVFYSLITALIFVSINLSGLIDKYGNTLVIFGLVLGFGILSVVTFTKAHKNNIRIKIVEIFRAMELSHRNWKFWMRLALPLILLSYLAFAFASFHWQKNIFLKHFPLLAFVGFTIYLIRRAIKYAEEKEPILKIITYLHFVIFYVIFEKKIDSIFALFLERNANRTIFGFVIPALNINGLLSLLILCSSVVFYKYKVLNRLRHKDTILITLVCAIFMFFVLYAACLFSTDGFINLSFYVLALFFLSLSDIFGYTRLYSLCRNLPPSVKTLATSYCYVGGSFAYYISRLIANIVLVPKNISNPLVTIEIYKAGFLKFAAINVFGLVIFLILMQTKIGKLMESKE